MSTAFTCPWTRTDFERKIRENRMAMYFVAVDEENNAVDTRECGMS